MANKIRHFIRLILATLLVSTAAYSASWRISRPDLIPESILNELKSKHPSIQDQADIDALVRDLKQAGKLKQVEVKKSQDSYTLIIEARNIIHRISIETITRDMRREMLNTAQKFKGFSDSPQIIQTIKAEIKDKLKQHGYFLPIIEFKREVSADGVAYQFSIDENIPCLIRSVSYTFALPQSIASPIKPGDICDIQKINEAISDIESELLERGYNQQKILKPQIDFDKASNTAAVTIPGTIGKKILYKINSPQKAPLIVSFLFGDELNTIDPAITAPDSMRTEILRKYRDQGFDDVKVSEPSIQYPSSDSIRYVFNVSPGPQYRIDSVQVEGVTAMSQEDAIDTMGLFTSLGNSPLLTQEIIQQAREALVSEYNRLGYWDAKVNYPRITKDPESGSTRLVFVVKEGRRRIFEAIEFKGADSFSTDQLRDLLASQENEPLLWSDIAVFEKNLREEYRKLGFLYITLNIDLIQRHRFRDIQTKILVRIQEGTRVKIGDIEIQGLNKTKVEVVRRELRFQSGDYYNPEAIELTRQALADLGLFSSVSLRPRDATALTERRDKIDYILQLREARSGTVTFGPGWSDSEGGRFTVESAYNNLNGEGRQVFAKAGYSAEENQTTIGNKTLLGSTFGLGLVEPWLANAPIDGTITFNQTTEAVLEQWEITRSIDASITHQIRDTGPKKEIELYSTYKTTKIEANESAKELLVISKDDVNIREFGLKFSIEARNNITWPTQGYLLKAAVGRALYVLGGNTSYTRYSLIGSKYFAISHNFVFATGLTYDSYKSVERSGDDLNILPSSERLESGGSNNNRGFREDELGPVVDYTELSDGQRKSVRTGGSQRFGLKLELRYQITPDQMAVTGFIDASNTYFSPSEEEIIRQQLINESEYEPEIFDLEHYDASKLFADPLSVWQQNFASYGLALNLLTPLGSINLSYGFPWKRCLTGTNNCKPRGNSNYRNIRGGQFHISVGATF